MGDKVVANKGTTEVLAVGTVTEEGYQWRPDREDMKHTVGVNWDTSFAKPSRRSKPGPPRPWPRSRMPCTATIIGAGPGVTATLTWMMTSSARSRKWWNARVKSSCTDRRAPERPSGKTCCPVAGPRGFGHADAAAVLDDMTLFEARERDLSASGASANAVWFMVANPSHWAWKSLFADGSVNYSLGLKRNFPQVRAGDLVVGYESTPTLRVVALAVSTGEFDPDGPADGGTEPGAGYGGGQTRRHGPNSRRTRSWRRANRFASRPPRVSVSL